MSPRYTIEPAVGERVGFVQTVQRRVAATEHPDRRVELTVGRSRALELLPEAGLLEVGDRPIDAARSATAMARSSAAARSSPSHIQHGARLMRTSPASHVLVGAGEGEVELGLGLVVPLQGTQADAEGSPCVHLQRPVARPRRALDDLRRSGVRRRRVGLDEEEEVLADGLG